MPPSGSTTAEDNSCNAVDVNQVALEYCDMVRLLLRMKTPSVRADFLAGNVLIHDDPEAMLVLIDGLHDLFIPPWANDQSERTAGSQLAAHHFKLLLEESEDIFEIPTDYVLKIRYRYRTWNEALRKLRCCRYWTEQCQPPLREERPSTIFEDPRGSPAHRQDVKTEIYRGKQVEFSDNRECGSERSLSSRTREGERFRRMKDDTTEDDSDHESRPHRHRKLRTQAKSRKKISASDHPSSSEYSSLERDDTTDSDATGRRYDRGYWHRHVVEPEHFDVDNGRLCPVHSH